MIISLTIVRYRKALVPVALMAMAVHRLPMMRQKGCTFWKLIGCGKDGAFTLKPDWQQWGLLAVWQSREDFDSFSERSFVSGWWKKLCYERWTVLLQPIQSHGQWSGKEPFGNQHNNTLDGPIAVLTRAKIKMAKVRRFWQSVPVVQDLLFKAPGRIMSLGIGETHYLAATFSVWNNAEDMKAFAYTQGAHASVIKQARDENWIREELFARFNPLESFGTINGIDPLAGINQTNNKK